MGLADIKKNEEFVRQLEIQGISQNDLSGEPRKGSSKTMTSEEKTFLLSEGKDIPINRLMKVMKEKFNKVYTYHALYYWYERMGIKPTTKLVSGTNTRVQYTTALIKDLINMWKKGYNTRAISEEIYKKYGERMTPNAITHKISRLRKNVDSSIPHKRHRTPKVSATEITPVEKNEYQTVTPIAETPKAEVTVSFPVKKKKKNVFVRIYEAIFNS